MHAKRWTEAKHSQALKEEYQTKLYALEAKAKEYHDAMMKSLSEVPDQELFLEGDDDPCKRIAREDPRGE